MTMDKLRVTATLSGQLITGGGYLTLDALLASATYSLTQDVDLAHNHLPLHCVEGLYYASAAIYEVLAVGKHSIVQGFRPDDIWLDHTLLKKNKAGNVHTKFRNMPDNILNSYKAITANTVTWYCEGDADKIWLLLTHLPMIGKKRICTVAEWVVEEGELDGVHGYADEPLRPVPIDMWAGDKSGPIVDAAWRPAYWDATGRTACYVG
jgi:hypothetical protein